MRVVPDGVADALDALLGVRQGLDIPAEDRRVYTLKGLALASQRAYLSGQCRSVRLLIDVLYPLRSTRSASASALAEDGFAASTVRQYLSVVRSLHITAGADPFQPRPPLLDRVLRGIQRVQANAMRRQAVSGLPLTILLLARLRRVWIGNA